MPICWKDGMREMFNPPLIFLTNAQTEQIDVIGLKHGLEVRNCCRSDFLANWRTKVHTFVRKEEVLGFTALIACLHSAFFR